MNEKGMKKEIMAKKGERNGMEERGNERKE
jgi:hypothetical protein